MIHDDQARPLDRRRGWPWGSGWLAAVGAPPLAAAVANDGPSLMEALLYDLAYFWLVAGVVLFFVVALVLLVLLSQPGQGRRRR
ncbi:MAG: hypothetical protein GX605_02285 [Chloroflexi bacterium]|nr:hypothetical protein [Chloroflexota bacterium]